MKKLTVALIIIAAPPAFANAKTYKEMFGADPQVDPAAATALKTMDFKQGDIPLPGAHATLKLPPGYYFLNGADASKVLVNIWGNPPGAASGTLGMIFPAKYPPEGQSNWGAVISYAPDGYVSDEDAESMDFSAVLAELQQGTEENNAERKTQGYEPMKLVGWASPPYYDKNSHALHWARDLLFGTDPTAPHTLNYQMRMLGREVVMELNFVAGMQSLQEIKDSIPQVIGIVNYNGGKKYSDHQDGDKLAAYGLGGLILAGAGAKVAAKVGFLALALVFLKKGFVFVLIALGAIFKPIMNLFRRKPGGEA
jgi:uncharacterized membrane-anchored protein